VKFYAGVLGGPVYWSSLGMLIVPMGSDTNTKVVCFKVNKNGKSKNLNFYRSMADCVRLTKEEMLIVVLSAIEDKSQLVYNLWPPK
jgi:hypothetical protein